MTYPAHPTEIDDPAPGRDWDDDAPDAKTTSAVVPSEPVESRRHPFRWGVFAYVALTLVTVALIWALVLMSVLVDHSVKTSAQAIDLVTAAGQEHQRTLNQVFTELDQTRAGTESELAKTRQLVTDTNASLATLVNTNSRDWQDIARQANQNVADASNQSLGLVQSTLQDLQSQEAALERAAAAREAAASARANEAAAALRAELAAARQREDEVRAALTAADQRAAAAASSVDAAARAALQAAVDSVTARIARAEALLEELIHRLPQPLGADAELVTARQDIEAAGQDLASVAAETKAGGATEADVSRMTAKLGTVGTALSSAEQALDRARAL